MHYIAPTYDEIAARAFERFTERGAHHGNDVEDWLEAERELLESRLTAIGEDQSDALEADQPTAGPVRRTRTAIAR